MSQIRNLPEVVSGPTHSDFCSYLPWACLQFGVPAVVTIKKIVEGGPKYHTETSDVAKDRKITSSFHLPTTTTLDNKESAINSLNPKIYITAVFNNSSKLVGLRFEDKNIVIPREVMEVMKLIIHKQNDLKRLEIKSGVDKYVVHEIGEILKVSNLTEICLDNSFVREGNYADLLEIAGLHYLSLSRCRINDKVIQEICKKLEHPMPASKSLAALILSTNMITDDGAEFLAEALRSNRKLAYINLADNWITDEGAEFIFDTLIEFSVRSEELVAAKGRRFAYLADRNTSFLESEEGGKSGDDKKPMKGKLSTSSVSSKKGKVSKTLKSLESSKVSVTVDLDRKTAKGIEIFQDPFHFPNIYMKESVAYCKGNNSLRYLNIAYNDLTYLSLKKILEVLFHQKIADIGKGLIDVKLHGNYLPVDCKEMQELEVLLDQKMSSDELNHKTSSRRRQSKNSKLKRDSE